MIRHKQQRKNAFSLLEVVIVVAIIAILAAIGIPRMSRGSRGAGDSALKANLAILRNAVDLYAAEHQGAYPTDESTIAGQLTLYTNSSGTTSEIKTGAYIYGPYLRSVPPMPVGTYKGNTGFEAVGTPSITAGWFYKASTGEISANALDTDTDDETHKYNDPNYY